MVKKLKAAWNRFAERRPGVRFTEMYEENQKERKSPAKRVAFVAGGIVLIVVGIIALPAPGPGMLVIALGAGLVARESEKLAHALDRAEVALRRLWKQLKARFA